MLDTVNERRIRKLTDNELNQQVNLAYESAYIESFGRDYEAHADAIQEYESLVREQKRRRRPS